MRAILSKRGLDPDHDLNVVGLAENYPHVVEMLEQGDLEAAVLSEPNVSMSTDPGSPLAYQSFRHFGPKRARTARPSRRGG
jgi:hypothetical protein